MRHDTHAIHAQYIAIVGAGYSGTLTAIQVLRRCRAGDRVLLFERRESFGLGVAFSTDDRSHLLNVRASNMSAFPDDPGHFVRWLETQSGVFDAGGPPLGDRFVPRAVYGRYLQSLLREAVTRCGGRTLELVLDDVVALDVGAQGVRLTVAGGQSFGVDAAVLAMGHLPPPATAGARMRSPWSPGGLSGIDPDRPVLLLGTGLTMVDAALSLVRGGHRGTLHAISRRGLLPQRHAAGVVAAEYHATELSGGSLRQLMRTVRGRAAEAERLGSGWRAAVDGLRPHTRAIWASLPLEERRRFLRHVRPWWDTHRHRMAPEVADAIDRARARGQLVVTVGRIAGIEVAEKSCRVTIRRRGGARPDVLDVDAVIDCTGLDAAGAAAADPLLSRLLAKGDVRLDPLGLGLDTDRDTGAVLDRDGRRSQRLFAVGPLTRGAHWEMIAVPDLRSQCAALAERLVARRPAAARLPLQSDRRITRRSCEESDTCRIR